MNNNYSDYYNNRAVSLSRKAVSTAIAEASASTTPYVERLGTDKKGDLWVRSFLINSRINQRGWSVDPSTIHQRVLSIIGKPFVVDSNPVTGRIDHPDWDSRKSAEANMITQRNKAIETVESVFYDKATYSYFADTRIFDPNMKHYINSFHSKKIPIPVSPQIIYDARKERPNGPYKDYEFSHIAAVEKAAYGPDARVLHVCEGHGDTCHKQFQNPAAASASSGLGLRDIPDCYLTYQQQQRVAPKQLHRLASASSSTSVSASGLELKRNTSSADLCLSGYMIAQPSNGKPRARLA